MSGMGRVRISRVTSTRHRPDSIRTRENEPHACGCIVIHRTAIHMRMWSDKRSETTAPRPARCDIHTRTVADTICVSLSLLLSSTLLQVKNDHHPFDSYTLLRDYRADVAAKNGRGFRQLMMCRILLDATPANFVPPVHGVLPSIPQYGPVSCTSGHGNGAAREQHHECQRDWPEAWGG
jgi:hypothetical protein